MAGTILLTDRWEITPARDIPELGLSGASAHPAIERGGTDRGVFALVPDGRLPTRGALLRTLKANPVPSVLSPIDFGPVDWPDGSGRRLCIILPRPLGGRLAATDESPVEPWSEEAIKTGLLRPLLPGLKAIALDNVAHRGVRPSNLHYRDRARRDLVLGECVAQPAGFAQPVAYETIEGGLALPTGRGPGDPADDLYALGVVILHLLGGVPPGRGREASGLIEEKLRRGSFAALTGELRVSLGMGDLVRGLLADDPALRWGFDDVARWLDGGRVHLRFPTPVTPASRPIEIGPESVTTPRGLARAMSRNRHGALELLRGGAIDAWLRRSLRDPILADRVARAVAESDTRNTYRDERLVARAAMALFPEAPLHYRGQILEYDGVGTALASAMLQGRDPGVVADLLQSGLLSFWSALRGGLPPAQAALSTQYEEARRSLQDSGPGGGIERVAYDLDSYLPCLSPFVRERQVGGITELLEALEAAALAGRIEGLPLDRHVAAFAASRSAKLDPKLLPPLSATDPASRALAVAAFFAILQAAHGPAALPALARLVRRGLEPALLAIRHLRSRERLATQLEGAVSDGDLGRLHRLVTDPELRRVDGERFRQARARFVDARRGLADCARERLASGERAAAIAGSLGAGFAAIVGGCVVLGYLLAVGVLS